MPDAALEDQDVLFLGQADGTFVDRAQAAGIDAPQRGRGAAVVDLNLDGLLDVVQVNRRDQRHKFGATWDRARPGVLSRWEIGWPSG